MEHTYVGIDLHEYTVSCGRLTVPLNWDVPQEHNATMELSLIRLRHDHQTDRIGSLVINPGGPGQSGVDAAAFLQRELPDEVLNRFDLVGFDPRGIGKSRPVICITGGGGADWDPADGSEFRETIKRIRDANRGCGEDHSTVLPYINTVQTARDMEALRDALGDDRLTYLGYSYGAELGATYAELFPEKVRAMVLDGALDPSLSSYDIISGQAEGFEKTFGEFARRCNERPQCPLGPDAGARFDELVDRLNRQPLHLNDLDTDIAGADVKQLTLSALYDDRDWQSWTTVLGDLLHSRSGEALTHFITDHPTVNQFRNHSVGFLAVMCADRAARPSEAAVQQLQTQLHTQFPRFGGGVGFTLAACLSWPTGANPIRPVHAATAPPIVVIGTRGDPATPYAWAQMMTKSLSTSVLLTWDGAGHTAYRKTDCIDDAVDRYLIDLKAPAAGVECPA
jgi:pimeloyl-ACP methyl ester carboxylesterase